MWDAPKNAKKQLSIAVEFTGNAVIYGSYMRRVVREWPISCENALTDYSLNRKAWLGHAACALAHGLPESIVRKAWGYLTNEQRFLANREAAGAISEWELSYAKSQHLLPDMGGSMLSVRHS
jgi:hypothetical protein